MPQRFDEFGSEGTPFSVTRVSNRWVIYTRYSMAPAEKHVFDRFFVPTINNQQEKMSGAASKGVF